MLISSGVSRQSFAPILLHFVEHLRTSSGIDRYRNLLFYKDFMSILLISEGVLSGYEPGGREFESLRARHVLYSAVSNIGNTRMPEERTDQVGLRRHVGELQRDAVFQTFPGA